MNWKIAGIILGLLLFLGVMGAAVYKIVQPTEGQKAEKIINHNKTYDYHPVMAFGCMRIPDEDKKLDKSP